MTRYQSFYGWKLLIAAGLLYFCSSAFVLIAGSVLNPLMLKDPALNFNAKMLGLGFTIFIWCQGIFAPLIGKYISRFGQRVSYITGGVIIIVGGLCMALAVKNAYAYALVFGVFLSIGSNMAGQITVQSSVNTWFYNKRALAMSIAMTIGGVGIFIAPVVLNKIVALSGGIWQTAWYFLAFLGAMCVFIAAFFIKNKPSDIGQMPDGLSERESSINSKKISRVYKSPSSYTIRQGIKQPAFWLIAILGVSAFSGYSLAISQAVIHFASAGFPVVAVTGAISLMGIANFVSKFAAGVLGDRIQPTRVYGGLLVVMCIATVVSINARSTEYAPYIYFFITGLGFGGCSTLYPVIIGNYFGIKHFPENLGFQIFLRTIFSGAIPVAGGYFFDIYGNNSVIFIVTSVLIALGAVSAFLIKTKN